MYILEKALCVWSEFAEQILESDRYCLAVTMDLGGIGVGQYGGTDAIEVELDVVWVPFALEPPKSVKRSDFQYHGRWLGIY